MKKLFKGMIYFIVMVGIFIGIASLVNPKITARMYELGKEALFQSINKKFVLHGIHGENNTYTLEVYQQSNNNSFAGLSGSVGFTEAYVVLRDKKGEVLLEPHWYASCDFIIGDLDVRWSANRVYFTKFNSIDLTSMSYDCY